MTELSINKRFPITRRQHSTLASILRRTLKHDIGGYEVKRFVREDFSNGTLFFSWTVGLKNDEGTLASVFGRDSYLAVIGKRGALKKFTDLRYGKKREANLIPRRTARRK